MGTKIRYGICSLCILLSILLTMTSCSFGGAVGIADAEINEKGELILSYTDGSRQNLGLVVGKDGAQGAVGADGADGSITIALEESRVALASAKGLRSAVSIVSKFKATVQLGGWRPGSSSTTTQEYSSSGSGVIYWIDKSEGDAFVITNYHVVYDSSSNTENGISDDIRLYLYGAEIEDKAIRASYVGGSLYYDIAVLRIEDSEILKASDACAVEIADSDQVAVGDGAIAIGNARGLGISSTSGVVSVDSEYITMTAADGKSSVSFRVVRVDTAINSGNSGGGLYDEYGRLIGIVNAKIVYEGVENIGYAIPSNVAAAIAENIIDYCYQTDIERVQRALLGITVSAVDSGAIYDPSNGGYTIRETVSVYEVNEGSLSDGVLEKGDILLSASVNGESTSEITRQYHAIDMMLSVRVGDVITLCILRGGEEQSVSMTVTQECLMAY